MSSSDNKAELATLKQGTQTLALIADQDLTRAEMKILHEGYLSDLLKAIRNGIILDRREFQISIGLCGSVDYTLSASAMHKSMGYIGEAPRVDPSVTERPRVCRHVEWKLVPLTDHEDETCMLIDHLMKEDGWKPAGMRELLSFGNQFKTFGWVIGLDAGTYENVAEFWAVCALNTRRFSSSEFPGKRGLMFRFSQDSY